MGSKAVLILGRFTEARKAVLDAIREALRNYDYVPIMFDFDPPTKRDLTETTSLLAHLVRFIIADITDAKSIIAELQFIAPQLLSVPIQPIILKTDFEYALFEHIERYPQVLPVFRYESQETLISSLYKMVITPAEKSARAIEQKRRDLERLKI